jgi:hypothetical protein
MLEKEGIAMASNTADMASTTNNSTSVRPFDVTTLKFRLPTKILPVVLRHFRHFRMTDGVEFTHCCS